MTERAAFDQVAAQMTAHGWSISRQREGDEVRIEGTHADGAAVMATARLKAKGWEMRYYVIGNGSSHWVRVRRDGLVNFLESGELAPTAQTWPVMHSKCSCRKQYAPTQARALRALEEARRRHLRKGSEKVEERVYRCPADARRWHMTAKTAWNGRETWAEVKA
ncbi:hypothetical protein ACF1AE_21880 [Streptomyces sp. NPDC014986]|uniref:hypothetical protein n=1 Tax=Streptomyces sp. NPDC014986 TaxID=3364934 RepID=UPI0037032896